MSRNHVFSRSWQSAFCGAALLAGASSVRAEEVPATVDTRANACESTYASAQARAQSGDLVSAYELFTQCSAEACDSAVWRQCVNERSELHAKVPSVVLVVSDHAGEPLVDVKVVLDGRLLASRLNGLALRVNPGKHTLAFSSGNETFEPATVTLGEGDRNHLVAVTGHVTQLHAQR